MPAGEIPLIDIREYIAAQRRERYRSFIVHGPAFSGKSSFARGLAEVAGGAYIDVLDQVAGSPDLSQQVDVLDSKFLKDLAVRSGKGASLVVVDEFDFLIPVWGGDLAAWLQVVRTLSVAETEAVVVWVVQSSPAVEACNLCRNDGVSRVLALDEIQAL